MSHKKFMKIALEEAQSALYSGEFPVGAVLEYQGKIICSGKRSGSMGRFANETDHAEIIALKQFYNRGMSISLEKTTLYCTLEPCLMCFGAILISGINKIVYAYEDAMGGGTSCDLNCLPPLYNENKISIISGFMRKQSLKLFSEFFSNPQNSYLHGTYLKDYTLKQSLL